MGLSILKPEEQVRTDFMTFLTSLGFPESYLVKEKALSELPHLYGEAYLPLRRVDILAYGLIHKKLVPLVLVECKAAKLEPQALHQILGYNHFVKAPFIALASKSGYLLFNTKTSNWVNQFETYSNLCLQAESFH